jgi:hypothetical protein
MRKSEFIYGYIRRIPAGVTREELGRIACMRHDQIKAALRPLFREGYVEVTGRGVVRAVDPERAYVAPALALSMVEA